jgi:hypothetical protein
VLDGEQHPTRVRASWISDDDIDALARDFPAAHRPATDEAPAVVDLTDQAPARHGDGGRES